MENAEPKQSLIPQKAYSSSEFWVMAVMLLPQVLSILGIDVGTMPDTDSLNEVVKQIHGITSNGTSTNLAMLYIAARTLLKWKVAGNK